MSNDPPEPLDILKALHDASELIQKHQIVTPEQRAKYLHFLQVLKKQAAYCKDLD